MMTPAGELNSPDSVYTIDRTLCALWSDDPLCFHSDDPLNTVHSPIRDVIHRCCDAVYINSIRELREVYSTTFRNDPDNIGAGIGLQLVE